MRFLINLIKKRKRAGALILLPLVLFFGACEGDKSNVAEKIVTYKYFCPWDDGKIGCYTACGTQYDLNGDGNIQPSEQPDYDSCTGKCDSYCDVTPILLAILEQD